MSPYVVLLIGGLLMLVLHIIMIDRLCFLGVVQDIFVCIALFSYTVISCILWYCLSHLFFIRPAIIHHPELLSPDAMRMNIKREQVDHAFRNLKSSRDRRNVIIDLDSPSPKKHGREANLITWTGKASTHFRTIYALPRIVGLYVSWCRPRHSESGVHQSLDILHPFDFMLNMRLFLLHNMWSNKKDLSMQIAIPMVTYFPPWVPILSTCRTFITVMISKGTSKRSWNRKPNTWTRIRTMSQARSLWEQLLGFWVSDSFVSPIMIRHSAPAASLNIRISIYKHRHVQIKENSSIHPFTCHRGSTCCSQY